MVIQARASAPPLGQPPAPPAPPAPPPAPGPEVFDLSAIDTPVEALLMPGVDLIAGMTAAQMGGRPTVRLEVGEQVVEYRNTGSAIEGTMNGQPFSLAIGGSAPSVHATGTTPGGAIAEDLSSIPGGVTATGSAGSVSFNQMFSLDPMIGFTGHVGDLYGLVGPDPLSVSLNLGADGYSVDARGTLGPRGVTERIAQGPNGTVIIEGVIGSTAFRQTLTPG